MEPQEFPNTPMAGRVDSNSTIAQPKPESKPADAVTWWSINAQHDGHCGPKDEVIEEISRDEKIPQHWRNTIIEQIKACNARAVEVHAHATPNKEDFIINIHIKKIF